MKKIVLLLFTLVFVIAAMFTGCAQKEGEQASAAASAGTEKFRGCKCRYRKF